MLASGNLAATTMHFLLRGELTVRCAFRGPPVTVPAAARLLKSCPRRQRRRLHRRLAQVADTERSWMVDWRKATGEPVRPRDIIAVLRSDDIVVEVAAAQHGRLVETIVAGGTWAAAGTQLGTLGKAASPEPPPERKSAKDGELDELLAQLLVHRQRDAETIKRLQTALAMSQQLTERLRSEVQALQAGAADPKFRRLKHEFSKHFHPDTRPPGDAERDRLEQIFREFWPVVEEIERS
jgi:hypothetical protein